MFLSVVTPDKSDASGLVKCLSQSLSLLGIADVLDQDSLPRAKEKPPASVVPSIRKLRDFAGVRVLQYV